MGTSRTPAQLTAKLEGYARSIPDANRRAVNSAAYTYKLAALREARQDIGSDLIMSRWPPPPSARRGPEEAARYTTRAARRRLVATYDIRGKANATALLQPRPMGKWKALEFGTVPHLVGAKTRATARAQRRQERMARKKFLRIGDDVRRGPLHHPGAPGKRTWTRALRKAKPSAMRNFRRSHVKDLTEAFKG